MHTQIRSRKMREQKPLNPNELRNIQLPQMNQIWPYFEIPDGALTTFKCQMNFREQPKTF